MTRVRVLTSGAALLCLLAAPAAALAQSQAPSTATPPSDSRLWIVIGPGFSVARAGCATCDRAGVFTNSKSLLIDGGVRVNRNVHAGAEVYWVSSRIESNDPVRTTFILGVAQFRPWQERGFFLRVGMGLAFAGNGLYNPIGPKLAPPYSTNAFGVMYGTGWVFQPRRRFAVQANATHHVAALGELTTVDGATIKNVVGNYWTVGAALVIR